MHSIVIYLEHSLCFCCVRFVFCFFSCKSLPVSYTAAWESGYVVGKKLELKQAQAVLANRHGVHSDAEIAKAQVVCDNHISVFVFLF
jgi:hypothetical protein